MLFLANIIMHVSARLVVVAGSIQDHILYFGNIAQFVLATIAERHASNIVLDLNLEDKVLIEDGSIAMIQIRPNVDIYTNVTQLVIGPRRSNKTERPLQMLIWNLGPNNY